MSIVTKLTETDISVMSQLRRNARQKITEISHKLGMPCATTYDKVKSLERLGMMSRYVSIIDFKKVGYDSWTIFAARISSQDRDRLCDYLLGHPSVNSLFRIGYEHDVLFDTIFQTLSDSESFVENIQRMFVNIELTRFHIIQELKFESFLPRPFDRI